MTLGLLPASIAALATGPILAKAANNRPGVLTFLDGFILVAIGGIVLLDVVPYMLIARDLWVVPCLIAGFCLPSVAERLFQSGVASTHRLVIGVAFVGLAIHSALDGSALAQARAGVSPLLGFGVLLHQIPVSMLIWRVLKAQHRGWMWTLLASMCLATALGFVLAPDVLAVLPDRAGEWLSAFVGGSLLHVVLHSTPDNVPNAIHSHGPHCAHDAHEPHAHTHARTGNGVIWLSGLGALVALASLVAAQSWRDETAAAPMLSTLWSTFRALCLDSAPAMLVGFLAAGLISTLPTTRGIAWISRGSRLQQAVKGVLVGMPLPICSCGVVPLYQSFVRRGASTTAALAFLVATPELGIDAILLSIPLLGERFAVARVVAAATTALAVAWLLGRRGAPHIDVIDQSASAPALAVIPRLRRAMQMGLGDMIDHTAPWILIGLIVASIAAPAIQHSWLARLDPTLGVVALAIVGLPLYVCASASTPLVAVIVAAGVSPGAGLALLITGPATNAATFGILTRMHGRQFAISFGVVMTLCAIVLGLIANVVLPLLPLSDTVALAHDAATPLQVFSLLVLALLFAASLLRRGPRAFFAELNVLRAV